MAETEQNTQKVYKKATDITHNGPTTILIRETACCPQDRNKDMKQEHNLGA